MKLMVPPPVPPPSGPRLALVRGRQGEGLDDAALARALAEGNPWAEEAAWDRFSPVVRGMLRRSLGPGAEVEDATQEVFIRFFQKVGGLREASAVRSFLIGIAVRVVRKQLRMRWIGSWLHLGGDAVIDRQAAAGSDHDAREALARFYEVLDRVGGEDRLAFVLRHIEGLELTEVAAALGISLATTKRRLARVSKRVSAAVARDPLLVDYVTGGAFDGR